MALSSRRITGLSFVKAYLLGRPRMRRLLPLISTLMLVLVLWTGNVAHAAERTIDCADVAAAAGHFEGDGDEVPSDSDKSTPHHHSACHGHCVALGSSPEPASQADVDLGLRGWGPSDHKSGADPGSALRPPIA